MKTLTKSMSFLRSIFPKTFSSIGTVAVIIVTVVVSAGSISYFFSQTIKQYIIEEETNIVFELIAKQAEKHLEHVGITSTFLVEENDESKEIFSDLNFELSQSLKSISAMKLFTPQGKLIWASLPTDEIGKYSETEEIAGAISKGRLVKNADYTSADDSALQETLNLFVPIKDVSGNPIAVVEVYFDTSSVASYTDSVGKFLWSITIVTVVVIYLILHYTLRRQDEKLVAQSTELQRIIDKSPIGIYTINKRGNIETYNPAMMQISGINDAKETIGKNVFDAEAYKKCGLDVLLHGSTEGIPFETEVEIESSLRDHKKTWRHYYGVPIKNQGGDLERVLVMVEDVTKQKDLEKQVREDEEGLENKIKSRTRELGEKLDELQRFHRLTVDRELRMVELKKQMEKMRIKIKELEDNRNLP
ncbi:MAG: PAS domain S-box protein [bacterium]|nr:PAS domain S-box protein [bacterium]